MVARLTDLEARRAKPRATAYKLAAGDGLCLVVMPGGGKYWWLRYRFAGREKTFSIGVYPGVSLRETESAAQKARALLRNDIDPTEDRRARKFALRMNAENTFGAAAELWVKHNTPRWKPATLEKVRQYLDKDLLPPLGRRPLPTSRRWNSAPQLPRSKHARHTTSPRRRGNGSARYSSSPSPKA
jgi:hypothetical protein